MIDRSYAEYAWEQAAACLAVDSPSGYTKAGAAWAKQAFEKLGFSAVLTEQGGFGSLSSGPIVRSMLEAYFHVGEYAEGAPKDKDKNGKDKNTKADKNTHDGKGDSQHDSDDR